uniref:Uncharacterized protein n=1 Tax=Oryza brachyantha TaxID=4533 RepID=J3MVL9_ORYBR
MCCCCLSKNCERVRSPSIIRGSSGVGAHAVEHLDGDGDGGGARVPPGAVPRRLGRHLLHGLEELLGLRRRQHLLHRGLH